MKILLLGSWLTPVGLLSQADPGDGWGIVAAYGAAAPFALLCLWVMNRKDKEIEVLRGELEKVTAAGMGQVVPALVRSTETVADAARSLEAANVLMHQLASRGLSAEIIERVLRMLHILDRKLDGT